MSMADIGAEMGSIQDEISINEDQLQLEATCRPGGFRLRVRDHRVTSENDVTRGRTVILRQDFPVVGLRLPQVTGRQYLSVSRHENEEFN